MTCDVCGAQPFWTGRCPDNPGVLLLPTVTCQRCGAVHGLTTHPPAPPAGSSDRATGAGRPAARRRTLRRLLAAVVRSPRGGGGVSETN